MESKSIFASATITNKSENQDSKGEIISNFLNAVLVADGLGSYKYAKQASNLVIESLSKQLENIENSSYLDFAKCFKTAKEKLVKLEKEGEKDSENLYGTTVIVLVETEKTIKIGYVGNGAIWHIRGNFDEFPPAYHFPWNAVNLLNPHSISENGKEALYRLISDNPNDWDECVPAEIEINKDSLQGDILMICTDGIYSEDQRNFGTNNQGIWVKYENAMQKFFVHLKQFFEQNSEHTKEDLETALNLYLEDVKPDLDDDATIGVLITEKTIDYQKNKRQQSIDENNTDNQR